MMKKFLLIMLILSMAVLGVACTNDTSTTTPAPGNETSTTDGNNNEDIVISFYEHSDADKQANAQIEQFNALDNGITVELSLIANDDYDDKLKVLVSGAGEDLDAFWIRGGAAMQQYASNNALLSLNDLAEDKGHDLEDLFGATLPAFSQNGQVFGMPTTSSAWLLWYNKTLFDAAEVDYPIDLTWEEFADLAAELNDPEAGLRGGLIPNWTMNLGASATGELLTDENLEMTTRYADILYRLYTEDKSIWTIEEMTGGDFDVNGTFYQGNTYMMVNGDWEFSIFQKDADLIDFEYAAAPLPYFEDKVEVGATVGGASCLSISAKSENSEAAYEFISWATASDKGAAILAENGGVAVYPSEDAIDIYRTTYDTEGVEYVFSAKKSPEQGADSYYIDLNDTYKEELQLALLGETTIEEAMSNYKTLRESIIND